MNYSQKGQHHFQSGSSEAHTQLIIDTLTYLGEEARNLCRAWRNETGMGMNIRTGKKFKYGLVGSSDIFCVVKGVGMVFMECKTGNAKQSNEQKNFENMVKEFGCNYFVIRSKEDALEIVKGLVK